ncbi:MAG: 23S rRNA pseudouridine(2604) synthase RluF [Clostridiales bacterium]|nr:23S rRNA pseudouridine(2604) synthase RluF [Clostridiales bacterium]
MENNTIRINKYLADSGVCSRREADRMIEDGRVRIDGVRAVLGDVVGPDSKVLVDGSPIKPKSKKVYIALNKPVGIVCTADPREPDNIVDFIGHKERIYPIGRLDKDSEGLILLTSDGDIVNKILRAGGGHEKEYEVEVDKPVTEEFLRSMASGVPILDTVTLPCKIRKTGEKRFTLTLVQGLNRQIRRMCLYLGYNVVSLKRVRIMNIRLGELKSGHWRNLTPQELKALMGKL